MEGEHIRAVSQACHWYPDKRRRFIVPLPDAEPLANAILAGVRGDAGDIPSRRRLCPDWENTPEAALSRITLRAINGAAVSIITAPPVLPAPAYSITACSTIDPPM